MIKYLKQLAFVIIALDNPAASWYWDTEDIDDRKTTLASQIYESLNPAELKRAIDRKLDLLYQVYQKKQKSEKVEPKRKLKPNSLTFLHPTTGSNFTYIVK